MYDPNHAPHATSMPRRSFSLDHPDHLDAVDQLRALARDGRLAATYRSADAAERRKLRSAAIIIAAPILFDRLTRVNELRRGHVVCATGIQSLSDTCIDYYYDDLEAVVDHLLRNSTVEILNLEGWLTSRLNAATVDAHRRRRGARGAVQRPRLPAWLAKELGFDPWLGQLAVEILTWVGVPTTAGSSLWPLNSWSDRRAAFTGTRASDDTRTVEREVEQVLAAMRTKPRYYEQYVERPLGAKTAPVAPIPAEHDAAVELPALTLVEPYEVLDAKLAELAAVALETIEQRAAAGEDLTLVVADVLQTVFGPVDVSQEIADVPHSTQSADERINQLVSDPSQLARVVLVVRDLLGGGSRARRGRALEPVGSARA